MFQYFYTEMYSVTSYKACMKNIYSMRVGVYSCSTWKVKQRLKKNEDWNASEVCMIVFVLVFSCKRSSETICVYLHCELCHNKLSSSHFFRAITQPRNMILILVDHFGTKKELCSSACLNSLKSRMPQLACKMCCIRGNVRAWKKIFFWLFHIKALKLLQLSLDSEVMSALCLPPLSSSFPSGRLWMAWSWFFAVRSASSSITKPTKYPSSFATSALPCAPRNTFC